MNWKIILSTSTGLILAWGSWLWLRQEDPTLANNLEYHRNLDNEHHTTVVVDGKDVTFDLLDPELAPADIRDKVMLGYHIVQDTQKYAKDYVGNSITCNNCHICGGITLGDRNGGISLVGVTTAYPTFSERNNRTITLADRINNCFMRSLNGRKLPMDSAEMEGLIAYLDWISFEVGHLKNPPWLGLDDLKSTYVGDPAKGELVYEAHCAICHQPDGDGTEGVPPLWGPRSFNTGAGMNTRDMLSSFIYHNMPLQEPILTVEQAIDVAAYIIKQPRPHFNPN